MRRRRGPAVDDNGTRRSYPSPCSGVVARRLAVGEGTAMTSRPGAVQAVVDSRHLECDPQARSHDLALAVNACEFPLMVFGLPAGEIQLANPAASQLLGMS